MACEQQPGRPARHDGVEVLARAGRAAAGGLCAVVAGLWCPPQIAGRGDEQGRDGFDDAEPEPL